MKKRILTSMLLVFSLSLRAQDAQEILQSSHAKCQAVINGYYEMTYSIKVMSDNDTSSSSFNCYFKKLTNDSLFASAFHYQFFYDGEYRTDVMYTGDDFVTFSTNDSTGEIMSKSRWADEIKSYSHNYTLYSTLTSLNSRPLPKDSDYLDTTLFFKFIGEKMVNNHPCYHVRVNEIPENDTTEPLKAIRIEYNYWIAKADYIPVQYTLEFDLVMNNDTMYQYEKFVLNKYEVNNLIDETPLTLASIPSTVKIKDYVPYESPEPLPKDTIAPGWTLFSLFNEEVSLEDLKGSIVLVDFFYKSCYPCMQALPALQGLHEKYKDKGLKIIGIDPYDKKEDGLADFFSNRGVSYTILLGGRDVAKTYRVSGYPTMYLIDKNGIIILVQVGFGDGVEEKLEEIILQNL